MLTELHVRDLGVIDDLHLILGDGMTALTGETGAGKTLLVGAIDLLVGGRADATMVRPGADEAFVEGRFLDGDGAEVVLARVIPAGGGRSRAYVDGRMATVSALSELGANLVDLHGQHAHQSLLQARVQRAALDAFGAIDTGRYLAAKAEMARIAEALNALGGDHRERLREIDLLTFQVGEIDAAGLAEANEESLLEAEADLLAQAEGHRDALRLAADALTEGGGADGMGVAYSALRERAPFVELAERARALQADAEDLAAELSRAADRISEDPERLAAIGERRRVLQDLRRKYGDTVEDVLTFHRDAGLRLGELESHGDRISALEAERDAVAATRREEAAKLGSARRDHAPALAAAIGERLGELAMPGATVEIAVGDEDPGDDVIILISANPGEPALPLAKVASGGELARTMLAARLVLTGGPPTLVFDEVDAGIGGAAAVAVGRALARVAEQHQVLVVTHLPQVAAYADAQVAVAKEERSGRTIARAEVLDEGARVVELGRMLSGQPDSETARGHAQELLTTAAQERSG